MRAIIKDKKGVLGLETVSQVIILLLVLAVIAIASFLALDALLNSGAVSTTRIVGPVDGFFNQTITLNDTPTQPAGTSGLFGVTYTGLFVTNATNSTGVEATVGNYTVNADGALSTTVAGQFNGSTVNISTTSFTNTVDGDSKVLVNNVTNATAQFFENIPTVMVILGAVVIILAVVLIILAVGRISGGARAAEFGGGNTSPGPGL